MRKILAQCPRCKARFKVIAEKVAGKKLRCASCQQAFRVPASAASVAAKSKGGAVEEIEDYEGVVELVDDDDDGGETFDSGEFAIDDFDDYEEPVQRRASSALPAPVGRKKPAPPPKEEDEPKPSMSGNQKLLIGGIAAGGLLLVGGLIFAVVQIIPSIKAGSKAEAVTNYERFDSDTTKFNCEYPAGWTKTTGGGTGGVPSFGRFEYKGAMISIRESLKGSAIGDMSGGVLNQGKDMPEEEEAVAKVHAFQREFIMEDYGEFKENAPVKISTKFGNARRSEFRASGKGPFGKSLRGYRATLLGSVSSFNVICQCPEADFDVLKPAFEKVINNIASN